MAFVTDEGHNPLADIPVIFHTVDGGGRFANAQDTLTVNTDSDGWAAAAFTLGNAAGNDSNVIEATFEGNTGPTASFIATGLVQGDPGNTRISGVVLDNSNNPIPNVTIRVEGTSREARTDANGRFMIDSVPVGPVHLIVDGNTAGTPGVIEYPTLMYELTTIAGADNTVGTPIYLLPIDLTNARWVGGNEDVTYTIPNVPGFLLTIKANSVTFPDGRREGYISVTQVHADKVPMVPQIGQQPAFIVTIQPPGTVFDPPAPITLPNVDGLAPGEKTNMYSFDHDLGSFVSIGTGTVTDDGMLIVSDPGVGVVKAGWHCGGPPAKTGSTNNCPECAPCNANTQLCTPLPSGTAVQGEECKECKGGNAANKPDEIACTDEGDPACTIDRCQSGKCTHTPVPPIPIFNPDSYGVDIAGLNQDTQNALACLRAATQAVGGSIFVNSAFRPQAYQDHLCTVWDRQQLLGNWNEAECNQIRNEIQQHSIIYKPADVSHHTGGNAFDANWNLPAGQDIDTLAAGCNLSRPVTGDPVHFER